MYWFVVYAARSHTRARVADPLAGPPGVGSWLRCAPPTQAEGSIARYRALLTEREWTELCGELGLNLEQACREEGRCAVCEAGPLPAMLPPQTVQEVPGLDAVGMNARDCVVGPFAAIAIELPGAPCSPGSATSFDAGICVVPLPETDAERDQVRSLFAMVAFDIGGSETELRCPDCASPELQWLGGTDLSQQMGCCNCGARLARESAFLRLGDLGIVASAPQPAIAAIAALPAAP